MPKFAAVPTMDTGDSPKAATALPGLVFRKSSGTSLREPAQRAPPPAQIMRADGTMVVGVPTRKPGTNTRARAMDRWMVVLTSPTHTPLEVAHRAEYQRVFYVVMCVNLVFTALVCLLANSGSVAAEAAPASRRLVPGLPGAPQSISLRLGVDAPGSGPLQALPTFSGGGGSPDVDMTALSILFFGTVLISVIGGVSVWALSSTGLAVYMVGTMLWFFFTVLHSPNLFYITRYLFDFVLVLLSARMFNKLEPSWFSANHFA